MRSIKFRARGREGGEWYYGDYRFVGGEHVIYTREEHERGGVMFYVDGNTVGQFTGLLDKNGKEIYEHDILRFPENVTTAPQEIIWSEKMAHYRTRNAKEWWGDPKSWWGVEVIGNVYENPELIKTK